MDWRINFEKFSHC